LVRVYGEAIFGAEVGDEIVCAAAVEGVLEFDDEAAEAE